MAGRRRKVKQLRTIKSSLTAGMRLLYSTLVSITLDAHSIVDYHELYWKATVQIHDRSHISEQLIEWGDNRVPAP